MDIAPYIAELLHQHNEVNVPSLGTFYKQHKCGYFSADAGSFHPPSHGLGFKEGEDNSLLTSYISQQKNISVNTASYFVEKFVSGVEASLADKGKAEIAFLGTLSKSKDGYAFTDVLSFDDEGEYFGLQPVKELTRIETRVPVVVPEQPDEVKTEAEDADRLPQAQAEEQRMSEEKEVNGGSAWSKVFIIAASLILIGIIAYLVYPQGFEVFRQKTNVPEQKVPAREPVQATVPKTLGDSLAQADTIYQELARQGFEVEKPRDTLAVSTEISAGSPPVEAVTFEIIGAAFARRTEAETYVKQLNARGVYAKIVENMPGSKLKISLGSFNEEAQASKELARIKKEFNKEAWIARVKPKKTN